MNSVEYWGVNNPLRALVQKHYEAPRLKAVSRIKAASVLEIGCGQGIGARIIYEMFSPEKYVGIDLDPKMIRRAIKKGADLPNATFAEGDAAQLEFPDGTFDLVVDFGIIHHIPNWRDALAEVHRTLRPGGEFLFEELSVETWNRGIGKPLKSVLEHPYDDMFFKQEFVDELDELGFDTETHENSPASFYHFWGRATKRSACQ
jgi:ubiquinone/menaquinone biosynthesis C-methylase UbiE